MNPAIRIGYSIVGLTFWCVDLCQAQQINEEPSATESEVVFVGQGGKVSEFTNRSAVHVVEFESDWTALDACILRQFPATKEVSLVGHRISPTIVAELARLGDIRVLNLSNCNVDETAWIEICKLSLSELSISGSTVSGSMIEHLKIGELQVLNAEEIGLVSSDLACLIELPNLRDLDLSGNCLDSELAGYMKGLHELVYFDISDNKVDATFFDTWRPPSSLRYINLQRTQAAVLTDSQRARYVEIGAYVADGANQAWTRRSDVAVLYADEELDNSIEAFRIRSINFIDSGGDFDLAVLQRFPYARSVDLPTCRITPELVADLTRMRQLQDLYVPAGCEFDNDAPFLFGKLPLRELTIDQCPSARMVLPRLNMPHLVRLSVHACGLSNADLEVLRSHSRLASLDLSNNELTHEIGETLRELDRLEDLDLSNNVISDKLFDVWSPGESLRYLRLSGNEIRKIPPSVHQLGNLVIEK